MVELLLYFSLLILLAVPLGSYMARVYGGEKTFLSFLISPLERFFYKLSGVAIEKEMSWKAYAKALIVFNLIGFIVLYLIQIFQNHLPLNPMKLPPVAWHLAINTAISFVTNTNWQSYGGETTMSYFTQMFGLTVQNFVSAATGMAACVALVRGFVRESTDAIGNFWVDLTRSVLYILLPLSLLWSVLLMSQGVVQTFHSSITAETLEGSKQVIAVGPAASQIAIKQVGSNGGGFFNVNSAHPFENPTPFSNFLEVFGILLIPVAFPFFLGASLKKKREGWAIFVAMAILFLICLGGALWAELAGNPLLEKLGVLGGLNMEGKEVRFGTLPSVLWSIATTVTSNGSVNSMHDSFMPLVGLVQMFSMAIGEVIFGGVGVGLIGMIFYAILAFFIIGLMIGRTPEFYGKKMEAFEMEMAVLAVIGPPAFLLILAAIAITSPFLASSLSNNGPHGFSEVLYAYCSAIGNNGSAFAGLNANIPFYNLTLAFAMLIGRFMTILPALAIAGSLARKKLAPEGRLALPTASFVFICVLVGTVILVGALTFFPAFTIGPILDHIFMKSGNLT